MAKLLTDTSQQTDTSTLPATHKSLHQGSFVRMVPDHVYTLTTIFLIRTSTLPALSPSKR